MKGKKKSKSGHSGKVGNTGVRMGKNVEGGQVVVEEAERRAQAEADKEKQKLAKFAHYKAQKEERDKERAKHESEMARNIAREVSTSMQSTIDNLSKELKEVRETQQRYDQSLNFMSLQVDGDVGGDAIFK